MKKILLADDNANLRSALRLILETRLGMEVIAEAHDMEHVLAELKDSRPDCIILDWELPGRPTRERVTILRALIPCLKVIAVSARPESRAEAELAKVDAFFCKTEAPEKILNVLGKICQPEEPG